MKSKNSEDTGDRELILQYKKRNNAEVLGFLYSRYVALVYGLSLKYFNDRERAKDAVMQIFEQLAVELHRHDIQNFKSWLYVFSKNYCLMELRKERALRKKEELWLADQKNFMEKAEELHPIDEDENLQMNQALKDCVEKLKMEQQRCIRLFYYENKSYRDISGQTGWGEKKVKSLLQNGKRNLKICLENKHVG